jgi:predicted transcriptional regulator
MNTARFPMVSTDLSFGEWLKRRRKTLDLTRDKLAWQVGCSFETIKKIESGDL